jgi:tRNA dimethylallyltransferase
MTGRHVIIIAGPTAVGKTSVGIAVARHFKTSIISADSRQCYREMEIGVARPTAEELASVPHYFISSHSIEEKVTAATFESYALLKSEELFREHDTVVMVGGTGLYIKAFCEGLDHIPEVAETIRKEINDQYKVKGIEWLRDQVRHLDPQYYSQGEIHNPARLLRALEVRQATGLSILHFRTGKKADRPFHITKIALTLPKEDLHRNINHRVDEMMEAGQEEECRRLLPFRHLKALQTVGYSELFDYFDGKYTREEAIEAIKKNTRQYAKRQLTWFRKGEGYTWLPPDVNAVIRQLAPA